MSRISAIGQNYINKIAFKGEDTKPKTEEQPAEEKSGMSTNTKIGIGVSAAVALAALGYAGYKGHLGSGIQKMLGGAEKATDDLSKKGSEAVAGAEKKGADVAASTEKAVNKEEVKPAVNQTGSEAVAKEIKKNPNNIYNLDDETFEAIQKRTEAEIAECEADPENAFEKLLHSYSIAMVKDPLTGSQADDTAAYILGKKLVNDYSEPLKNKGWFDNFKKRVVDAENIRDGKTTPEILLEKQSNVEANSELNKEIQPAVNAEKAAENLGNKSEDVISEAEKNVSKVLADTEKETSSAGETIVKTETPEVIKNTEVKPETEAVLEPAIKSPQTETLPSNFKFDDRNLADITPAEFNGLIKYFNPEDTVLTTILEKSDFFNILKQKPKDKTLTLKSVKEKMDELTLNIEKVPELVGLRNKLMGKDSFLFKKVEDMTLGDIKPFVANAKKAEKAINDFGENIDFEMNDEMINGLNALDSSMTFKQLSELLKLDMSFDTNKTGVESLADYLKMQLNK